MLFFSGGGKAHNAIGLFEKNLKHVFLYFTLKEGAFINVRILTNKRNIQPHTRINLRLRQPNIKSQNSTGEHEHILRQFSPNNG